MNKHIHSRYKECPSQKHKEYYKDEVLSQSHHHTATHTTKTSLFVMVVLIIDTIYNLIRDDPHYHHGADNHKLIIDQNSTNTFDAILKPTTISDKWNI